MCVTDVIRYAGVICAALGALVVAPHVVTMYREAARRRRDDALAAGRTLAARVKQAILRRPGRVVSVSGTASAIGLATATVTGRERAMPLELRSSSLAVQVSWLAGKVKEIGEQLDATRVELQAERDRRAAALAELSQTLTSALDDLRRQVDAQARSGQELDARGMPLVAFGIVLSGIPDELAKGGRLGLFLLMVPTLLWAMWGVSVVARAWRDGAPPATSTPAAE